MDNLEPATSPADEANVLIKSKKELLGLSDEILELIVEQVDRHDDLPNLRLACKKLLRLSERYMYRNFVMTLPEEVDVAKWRSKLDTMPDSIKLIKYLTIMNQSISEDGFFYRSVVPCPHSYRIQRWTILEQTAMESKAEFEKAAFFAGSKFRWDLKLDPDQLISFRWRHATTLSYELLCKIMTTQAKSLQELELTMITPPSENSVDHFSKAIEPKVFPKLRKLIYHGLSHTEPIPQNMPARGGRFRMIRPLFRKTYEALEELVLSQDHCISQIGKTPLINGRTFNSFLCDLDDIYDHTHDPCPAEVPTVTLKLKKLELGGFKVGTLFNVPSIPTAAPKVQIELSNLTRLVLNECDRLAGLLRELVLRKEEIRLVEVGLRVKEQREDSHTGDWKDVAESLEEFLTSFEGLKVLSILWHGHRAPAAEKYRKVLVQHHKTLQAYSFSTRTSSQTQYRFTVKHNKPSPWTEVFPDGKRPRLREVGLDLPDELCTEGYPALRTCSQFKTLRTAHIRHFPKFAKNDTDQEVRWWRDYDGSVTRAAKIQAAQFAELIALPYFEMPTIAGSEDGGDVQSNNDTQDVLKAFDLATLAEDHAKARNNKLQPGFHMKDATTPDPTQQILRHRADTDFRFASILRRMHDQTATGEEMKTYERFYCRTQRLLGFHKPSKHDKPKLRLLVVGDWRYRDQLNLAGPRTWNFDRWSAPPNARRAARRARFGYEGDSDDENGEPDSDLDSDDYIGQDEHIRDDFFKEFDVSLRPIFFKIAWKAEKNPVDDKWRWKAKATPLEQTTLEGYGWLGDVKTLDFAWQD